MERFLTTVRLAMLDAATSEPASATQESTAEFCCALAQQCFNNEYVYAVADDELASVWDLRDGLVAALRSGDDVPPLTVAAVAIGMPVITYLIFERWFLVPLPKGPVEEWLGL